MVLAAIIIWHSLSLSLLYCFLKCFLFFPFPIEIHTPVSWMMKHLFLSPCTRPVSSPSPFRFSLVMPQWMTNSWPPPCPRRILSSCRAWAWEWEGFAVARLGGRLLPRRGSCIPCPYPPSQWPQRPYITQPHLPLLPPLSPSPAPLLLPSHTGLLPAPPVKLVLGTWLFLSLEHSSPRPLPSCSLT